MSNERCQEKKVPGSVYDWNGTDREPITFIAWENAKGKGSRGRINVQLEDGTWRNVPRSSVVRWPV
jgi:hypothetical protein